MISPANFNLVHVDKTYLYIYFFYIRFEPFRIALLIGALQNIKTKTKDVTTKTDVDVYVTSLMLYSRQFGLK